MKWRHTDWYVSAMPRTPHRQPITVGVRELRDHLSEYLDDVESGGELIVTERGRPVARLVSAEGGSALERLVAAGIESPPSRRREPSSSFGRVRARGDLVKFVLEQRR
jgi:prevent-host-death family protein